MSPRTLPAGEYCPPGHFSQANNVPPPPLRMHAQRTLVVNSVDVALHWQPVHFVET